MLSGLKNGYVDIGGSRMDYIAFGKGEPLIFLPGLGDGLRTVKGMAAMFSVMYRKYGEKYRVYVFSRKEPMPEGYTTRDMAADQAAAMVLLGIEKAHIIGVSQGGMIAQHLAADYPEKVRGLILAVTTPKTEEITVKAVSRWIELAESGLYKEFLADNIRAIYSYEYYRKNRRFTPIAAYFTKPKSFERFFIMADACLTHDAENALPQIKAPTFVIGGELDKVVGPKGSWELAKKINGAKLRMYKHLGHSVYEEAHSFHDGVLEFLSNI